MIIRSRQSRLQLKKLPHKNSEIKLKNEILFKNGIASEKFIKILKNILNMNLKKFLIKDTSTIHKAMEKLQNTSTVPKLLLVVNNYRKLLGALTDGDIRRALLNGSNLSDNIKNTYNNKPLYFLKKDLNIGKAVKELYKKIFLLQ